MFYADVIVVHSLKYHGDYQAVCYLSTSTSVMKSLPFLAFFGDYVTGWGVCSYHTCVGNYIHVYVSCESWLEIVTMALCRKECGM